MQQSRCGIAVPNSTRTGSIACAEVQNQSSWCIPQKQGRIKPEYLRRARWNGFGLISKNCRWDVRSTRTP